MLHLIAKHLQFLFAFKSIFSFSSFLDNLDNSIYLLLLMSISQGEIYFTYALDDMKTDLGVRHTKRKILPGLKTVSHRPSTLSSDVH